MARKVKKFSAHFGPNCPDFLKRLMLDALAELPRELEPGESDPKDYPDDFAGLSRRLRRMGRRRTP